jgi:hypothetical protein
MHGSRLDDLLGQNFAEERLPLTPFGTAPLPAPALPAPGALIDPQLTPRHQTFVEAALVLTTIGIVALVNSMVLHKVVVLNLFFLPIVLAGFFLGCYRAGALALFAVMATSIVVVADLQSFLVAPQPLVVALQLCVWGGILGLTAVLVGTLSDERRQRTVEAREAHRGVAEVLAAYLESVNPCMKTRTQRILGLAEQIGRKLKLTPNELDDMRVASLLVDLEPLEITSRVIRRAVGELETEHEPRTLPGTDLVRSLGAVLTTAFPIVQCVASGGDWRLRTRSATPPLAAEILRAARAYDQRLTSVFRDAAMTPAELVAELRDDDALGLPELVLDALKSCVCDPTPLPAGRAARTTASVN